jgi:hypothetical protein
MAKRWQIAAFCIVAWLGALAGLPGSAAAALIVTVSDAQVNVGQSTFVDIFVRSETGEELLDQFRLVVRITPASPAYLQFTDPPLDPQVDVSDPAYAEYIFFGDSAAATIGPPSGQIRSSVTGTNDVYLGGDGTLSAAGVFVPLTDTLLARIQVEASASTPPGSLFTVSVEEEIVLIDPDTLEPVIERTVFLGPTPEEGDPEEYPYIALPGTVAAVPEPASFVVFGGLLGLCVAARARRRKV